MLKTQPTKEIITNKDRQTSYKTKSTPQGETKINATR